MKNYSIVRIGNEYVVQAGEASILKVTSRRQAAKLVTEAAELLEQHAAPSGVEHPSIAPASATTPDLPRITPDPAEVS
jgi:hypothetical protein